MGRGWSLRDKGQFEVADDMIRHRVGPRKFI